jgi:hypothetical protein
MWVLILGFVSVAVIAAGCGGRDSNREYVNPYDQETSGRTPAPVTPKASESGPKERVGDATGGGVYGKRVIKGSGEAGLGGVMDEGSFREWASVGKEHSTAKKLFQQYFQGKESSGSQDVATLDRAIALYEQLVPRADALLSKYENNREVEQQYMEIMHDLKTLKDEKND